MLELQSSCLLALPVENSEECQAAAPFIPTTYLSHRVREKERVILLFFTIKNNLDFKLNFSSGLLPELVGIDFSSKFPTNKIR